MAKAFKLRLTELKFISAVDRPAQETAHVSLIKSADSTKVEAVFDVAKMDDELGLVFGWAFTTKADGKPYSDLHGDEIQETDLIKVCAEFMTKGGASDVMHDEKSDGRVVFAMPLLPEVNKALGLTSTNEGFAVAIKPSTETFAKFKSGELKAFSLGGYGVREEKAAPTEAEKALAGALAKFAELEKQIADLRSHKSAPNISPQETPAMPTPEEIAAQKAKDQAATDLAKSNEELRKRLDDQSKAIEEMTKRADVLAKSLADAEEARKGAELAKSASEMMDAMPGTLDTHVATLKALHAITDEPTRKAALEAMKASNEAFKMLAVAKGHSVLKSTAELSAEDAYYKACEEFAKANQLETETEAGRAKASFKFSTTPEGSALYKRYAEAKPAAAR